MFRTVPLSIIRSFSLYTQQWCMSYRLSAHIPLLCVQWKTPDDGQTTCPKHVEFYSKNKFEKLVHLVGFIIRIFHYARSPERHMLWKISTDFAQSYHRFVLRKTWTSKKAAYFSKLSYHTKCQEATSDSNCVTSAIDVPTDTVLVTPAIGSHKLQSFDFV